MRIDCCLIIKTLTCTWCQKLDHVLIIGLNGSIDLTDFEKDPNWQLWGICCSCDLWSFVGCLFVVGGLRFCVADLILSPRLEFTASDSNSLLSPMVYINVLTWRSSDLMWEKTMAQQTVSCKGCSVPQVSKNWAL